MNKNGYCAQTDVKKPLMVVSYSQKDKLHLKRFETFLCPLVRKELIDYWSDERLPIGIDYTKVILKAFKSARIIVVLISANFLASDFVNKYELPIILEAVKKRGARVMPVIVGVSSFEDMPELSRLQATNPPNKPLNILQPAKRDLFWRELAKEIKDFVTYLEQIKAIKRGPNEFKSEIYRSEGKDKRRELSQEMSQTVLGRSLSAELNKKREIRLK